MRVQYLIKWHRDFENCATHIHDDDRIVTPRTSGTDVNVARIENPMLENRPVTIRDLTDVLNVIRAYMNSTVPKVHGYCTVCAC